MNSWAVLAVTSAATAVLLALGSPRAELARLASGTVTVVRTRQHRPAPLVVAAIAALALVWLLLGRVAATLSAVAVVVLVTTVLMVVEARRRRRILTRGSEIAEAAGVLAGQLRVGQVPGAALLAVAAEFEVLAPAAAAQRVGAPIVPALREAAAEPGGSGLGLVAAAWQLADRTGTPLAAALEQTGATLAEEEQVRATVESELAPARATGRLLAVLPLAGIVVGVLIGGDPIAFLLSTPIGNGCLIGGALLAAAGMLWSSRLAGSGVAR